MSAVDDFIDEKNSTVKALAETREGKEKLRNSRVSQLITQYLDYAKKTNNITQSDVNSALGLEQKFRTSNFMTLVKSGRCKLPANKIEPFIKACGIEDGSDLIEAIAEEYYGDFFAVLKKIKKTSFFDSESKVIGAIIDAKREADEELRREGMADAANRSEQQLAEHASTSWDNRGEKLKALKMYVKENLLVNP